MFILLGGYHFLWNGGSQIYWGVINFLKKNGGGGGHEVFDNQNVGSHKMTTDSVFIPNDFGFGYPSQMYAFKTIALHVAKAMYAKSHRGCGEIKLPFSTKLTAGENYNRRKWAGRLYFLFSLVSTYYWCYLFIYFFG